MSVADQHQRDAIVEERLRNVVVEAGAGTGKTTVLVRRLVNLIAPRDGSTGFPIERIAAITFTRRAAGELRFRIREEILRALSSTGDLPRRQDQLRVAFAGVDTAYIGTIHSFADRLLRLCPVEAWLSPSYEIAEDDGPLIQQTYDRLMHAVETGALPSQFADTKASTSAAHAAGTILDALAANLRAESQELEYFTRHGLNGLVAEFIRKRDAPPPDVPAVDFDAVGFRRSAERILRVVEPLTGSTPGTGRLKSFATVLQRLLSVEDPVQILRDLNHVTRGVKDLKKGADFPDDPDGWKGIKAIRDDGGDGRSLLDELLAPPRQWLAHRLVALFPVVTALYERVKTDHKVVDQIDLLLKLRDVLLSNKKARRFYQGLFDHVLVDEFQDTDPLQAEILLYLCEAGAKAESWQAVAVADGKLTTVGDPKQSIYRFRRADVAMYDAVRRRIEQSPTVNAKLSVNFRSTRGLVEWFDASFTDLLGTPPTPADPFDAATGEVFYQALQSYRASHHQAHVHVLPFDVQGGSANVETYRALEAEALAHYLRWLVEIRQLEVIDTTAKAQRPVRYGDVAILAVATAMLDPLFPELDRMGVPYVAAGGRLFLEDPLHRQFILGLRAIADPSDGVAQAALLRPPFFAVDLGDHVGAKVASGVTKARLQGALELVKELRRRRFERAPGQTARDLLERTAFGRSLALGPNGAQRLLAIREICIELERIAAIEGVDYDGVTARMREWITRPIQLDPPAPVGMEAVRVMTVHQAKGLEFPVVVLWDGKGQLVAPRDQSAWVIDGNHVSWSMALDGLPWTEPRGVDLRGRDKQYADAERKRVVYVAATRARDLLVIPKAGQPSNSFICGRLLNASPAGLVEELEVYRQGQGASWAASIEKQTHAIPVADDTSDEATAARWNAAATASASPRFRPVNVTGEARGDLDGETESLDRARHTSSRYGPVFGETVHCAIGIVLRDRSIGIEEAVTRAAAKTLLMERQAEAVEDVSRAIAALEREGLVGRLGVDMQIEYPVAGQMDDGKLLVGYVDLASATPEWLAIVDFKTDEPPGVGFPVPAPYAKQVALYAQLLDVPGRGARSSVVRKGLLFTADGSLRWL